MTSTPHTPPPEAAAATEDDKTTTPVETLATSIEEEIVLGRLHPRERLVEDDLMKRFAAKRHIVRQALFQLEAGGLVERIRNRGAFVRSYTPAEVQSLYDMRELLEVAAAERLPLPAPQSLIDELESVQVQHGEAVEQDDFKRAFRHNIAFHRTLYAACGNAYLSDSIEEFAQKAHAIRFISTTDRQSLKQAWDEHNAIIASLKNADREQLLTLCRQHLKPSKELYIQLYQRRNGDTATID